MFGYRPYNGENSMIMNGSSPIIREITCNDCGGKGVIEDEDDEPVSYNGITIQRAIPCEGCGGMGIQEDWR